MTLLRLKRPTRSKNKSSETTGMKGMDMSQMMSNSKDQDNRRDLDPIAFVIRENNCNPLRKVCVHPMEPSEIDRATVSWLKGEGYGRMLPSSELRPHCLLNQGSHSEL